MSWKPIQVHTNTDCKAQGWLVKSEVIPVKPNVDGAFWRGICVAGLLSSPLWFIIVWLMV
jgi:hypothetical protein